MITPTGISKQDYINAVYAGNRSHARIVFPVQDITFTEDDISSAGGITISTDVNPSDDMVFGTAACTEVVINFINNSKFDGFDWTEEFHVDFGVEVGNNTYWVTVGYFTGIRPKRYVNSETIQFTAYDRMTLFDVPADTVLSSIVFPTTIKSVFTAICNYVGVSYVDMSMNASLSKNPFKKGMSCREVISIIGEYYGMFVVIDENGSVKFVNYHNDLSPAYLGLTSDMCFHIDLSDYMTAIVNGVKSIDTSDHNNDEIYPSGVTTGNFYYVVNNPIYRVVDSAAKTSSLYAIYRSAAQFTPGVYSPCRVEALGNWILQVGDIIHVICRDYHTQTEKITYLPIFSRVFTWNGGCVDVLESKGNLFRSIPNEYEYESLSEADIVNDLTETEAGYVLDARQGKTLNEEIELLTNDETTFADFLAKAQSASGQPMLFYANNAVMYILCGLNSTGYGVCCYVSGYLMWLMYAYNDEVYSGWYKTSDSSTKVYLIHNKEDMYVRSYVRQNITIPDNDSFNIDLSSVIPSGYSLWDCKVQIFYQGDNTYWALPYFSDTMSQGMFVRRILNNVITIRNSSTGWGSCDLYITAFLKKT